MLGAFGACALLLGGQAAAQLGGPAAAPALAPQGGRFFGGGNVAEAPLGVSRDEKRKYVAVSGSVFIADETTFEYEYDYITDYEAGETETRTFESTCGDTSFFISSYDDETVTVSANRFEELRPECTGGDEEPDDYGYFDSAFYCAQAEIPKADAVSYSLDATAGTLTIPELTLTECDYGDYDYGPDPPAPNPLIGKTVSAEATVECPIKNISVSNCQNYNSYSFTPRSKYTSRYRFDASCDGNMVETFTFGGMDYKFDYLEFGNIVEKNFRSLQQNRDPTFEVPAHRNRTGPLPAPGTPPATAAATGGTATGTTSGEMGSKGGKGKKGGNMRKKGNRHHKKKGGNKR